MQRANAEKRNEHEQPGAQNTEKPNTDCCDGCGNFRAFVARYKRAKEKPGPPWIDDHPSSLDVGRFSRFTPNHDIPRGKQVCPDQVKRKKWESRPLCRACSLSGGKRPFGGLIDLDRYVETEQ